MNRVFIVVLNFNGKKDTLECLESLSKLPITNYQLPIIVVDNGSTDGSVEAIKKMINGQWSMVKKKKQSSAINHRAVAEAALARRRQPSAINHQPSTIHLLENKENLGFAGGNNVGIRYALKSNADFVLILNNDTLVDKNLVVELLKAAEVEDDAGIFGPKIYFAPGFEYHKKRYQPKDLGKVIWYAGGQIDWANVLFSHRGVDEVDEGQYDQREETDYISGCAMLVRREVFEKIGLFDERYFAYLEDADFCQKAKMAGWKMVFVPKAIVWHKVSQTAGGIGSETQDYYITRNRLLFGLRFACPRSKFALFRESFRLLFFSRQKRKAVLDFYLNRFGGHNV